MLRFEERRRLSYSSNGTTGISKVQSTLNLIPSPTGKPLSLTRVHTLVIGSGAAGLNAAVQLVQNGVNDLLVLSEGLDMGTSINTGSDKQTYYKLSLTGVEGDSPQSMAGSYMSAGSMHGDLALVEAGLSVQAFMHLVNLGVPFPRDEYGQFVGYKTDHDPRQRATSIGPYTSREMCRRLIQRLRTLQVPIREGRVVIRLVTVLQSGDQRVAGALTVDAFGVFEAYLAENIVFAVGGPGGLYQTSVYPHVHTGAIGLALLAGAAARSLPESQYGLASTKFRWNVSGTYMQVIPRVVSRAGDGESDEREFLAPYFDNLGQMNGMVFLKGYQWPFDARKVIDGSSLVDILVYIETVVNGRRVYLDYRRNPDTFCFEDLPADALDYLTRSGALQGSPYRRLEAMNPGAIELYRTNGIDLDREPLEVAVCAQHNNGGLAGNIWWESINLRHLFPIGEVNGSHGVARPGGTALNAGQVGGIRAAEWIANRYASWTLDENLAQTTLTAAAREVIDWSERANSAPQPWLAELDTLRRRMSHFGAHIRSLTDLQAELPAAWEQAHRILHSGCAYHSPSELGKAFTTRQLCLAHAVYLDAILFMLKSKTGSRGSAIVLDPEGQIIHPKLGKVWRILPEDLAFRGQTLETVFGPDGAVHRWVHCRPVPRPDSWFETTWARFRSGEIYKSE